MTQLNNLSRLSSASFFDKTTLQRVVEVADNSLYSNIKRWLKQGELIQLKRGLYVTKDYFISLTDKQSYNEFVANILKQPSYLSGEYVLQKYSLLSESVFALTSITLKKTGSYQNSLGTFIYSSIKNQLFTGFNISQKNGFEIKEATKVKALFDFLYFRLLRTPNPTKDYIASFRLNLAELQESDWAEFTSYVNLSGSKKMFNLPIILKELANDR